MNYLSYVKNAVHYIELNLTNPLRTEDVARDAAFSKFHFHRIFQSVTGDTVTNYIRKRRLTEAAKELITTHRKIIDIAFDYQFENPESFTRAFRRMFHANPGAYRKGNQPMCHLYCHPNLEAFYQPVHGGLVMEPKFLEKHAFTVVGMRYFGSNPNNDIPKLWDRFIPRTCEITHRCNDTICFGVCFPPEDKSEDGEFEYVAGVETPANAPVPDGMVKRTVPAGKYAVFTHKGPVEKIDETMKFIAGDWHPKSGYTLAERPDFELYDHRFNADQEDSEFDIYIPLK